MSFDYRRSSVRNPLSELLDQQVARRADERFIVHGPSGTELTFEAFDRRSNAVAHGLIDRGVTPGDAVSIMTRDSLIAIEAMFGINKTGAIYAPINTDLKGPALSYHLDDTDPSLLVIEDRYLDRLNEVAEGLDTTPPVVVISSDASRPTIGGELAFLASYESLRGDDGPVDPGANLGLQSPASVIYTSGTTGLPKGVRLPYGYIFENVSYQMRAVFGEDDVIHTALPMYHVGGTYTDVVPALIAGGQAVLWDEFSTSQFWERIETYDATIVTLVSVMISWLREQDERPDDSRTPLSKVHLQPLPEDYRTFAARFGIDFITVSYGQTEAGTPIAAIIDRTAGTHSNSKGLPPEAVRARAAELGLEVVRSAPGPGYMGQPIRRNFETEVVDEVDQRLEPGAVGELVLRPTKPDLLFSGYHARDDETLQAIRNLWFHTGDMVYRDQDENYFFVGRSGDIIRRRGENVSSSQVQQIVDEHAAVARSAAFPVPAAEGMEDEIALVIQPDDHGLTDPELIESVRSSLPAYMYPDQVFLIEAMPVTRTNKIRKGALRERFDLPGPES